MDQLVINGRFLGQRPSGVQRVATQLSKRLLASKGARLSVPRDVSDSAAIDVLRRSPDRRGLTSWYLWEQMEFPWTIGDGVGLSLCNLAPALVHRQAVMIHDAAMFDMPENYSARMVRAYRMLLPMIGARARVVFTVSDFSRDRLVHHGIAPRDRIVVVPNGVDHVHEVPADDDAPQRFGLPSGGFVLAVGSLNPNKNLRLAIDAISALPETSRPKLAIVGAADPAIFRSLEHVDTDRVRLLGPVPDRILYGLIRQALCLVFPSRYEGFGLPPLEAMALGTPVIVAEQPAIREACGPAALYCDPDDPAALAEAIARLQDDPKAVSHLRAAGMERAGTFTWDAAASTLRDSLAGAFPE